MKQDLISIEIQIESIDAVLEMLREKRRDLQEQHKKLLVN